MPLSKSITTNTKITTTGNSAFNSLQQESPANATVSTR